MSRPLAWTVGTLALVLAGDDRSRCLLDAEVAAAVVEERLRGVLLVAERVDSPDEEVVVAGRERLDDRALECRDRAVDERQPRRPGVPRRAAELAASRLDGRAGEAVRDRLLVLGQDVDRVASGAADGRGDEAAPV